MKAVESVRMWDGANLNVRMDGGGGVVSDSSAAYVQVDRNALDAQSKEKIDREQDERDRDRHVLVTTYHKL